MTFPGKYAIEATTRAQERASQVANVKKYIRLILGNTIPSATRDQLRTEVKKISMKEISTSVISEALHQLVLDGELAINTVRPRTYRLNI